MPLTGTFPLVNMNFFFSLHWAKANKKEAKAWKKNIWSILFLSISYSLFISEEIIFWQMLKHPHRLSIPSKCYFPQIVWFTVNEFSLPIIIWRSFRSRPRHRGHCCRKHERKYLEISASSLSAPLWGDLDIPRPVNGGNYQLIKETSNYETHCFFRIFGGKNLTVKL